LAEIEPGEEEHELLDCVWEEDHHRSEYEVGYWEAEYISIRVEEGRK
jgi:hypothetical protein